MFPLLVPAAIEAVELAAGAYSAYKLSKAVKNAYKLSKVSKVKKYSKSANVSKYSKSEKSKNLYRVVDTAILADGAVDIVSDTLGRYRKTRQKFKPISDPNEGLTFPEYTGSTLIDAIKHGSDSKQVATKQLVNSLDLQTKVLNDIAVSIQTGTLVQSTMLPQIFSGLVSISTVLEEIATIMASRSSAPVVNIDLQPVADAVSSLKPEINPQSRKDFFTKQNSIADYKLTPKPQTDMFGNDEVTMSPLEVQTKKNLADAVDKSLKNETKPEDVDFFDDLLPDLDLNTFSPDVSKIFKHNGVYSTLQHLIDNMGEDGQGFADINLKE